MREISSSPIDLAENFPTNCLGRSMRLLAGTQCLHTTSFQYSGRCRSSTVSVEKLRITLCLRLVIPETGMTHLYRHAALFVSLSLAALNFLTKTLSE